jgi:flagellar assembly factor FliW
MTLQAGTQTERTSEGTELYLPEGMLGFSRLTRYVLIQEEDLHPFLWLQSLDDPGLAFPVVDPQLIDKDYGRVLPSKELASLKIRSRSELLVLVVAILRAAPGESGVNLKAPILINHTTMIGRQIILTELDSNRSTPVADGRGESGLSAPVSAAAG